MAGRFHSRGSMTHKSDPTPCNFVVMGHILGRYFLSYQHAHTLIITQEPAKIDLMIIMMMMMMMMVIKNSNHDDDDDKNENNALNSMPLIPSESESESEYVYCHKNTTKHQIRADQLVRTRETKFQYLCTGTTSPLSPTHVVIITDW